MWSDCLVFILSSLWGRRIRGLWKLLDGRDRLREKLGLVLMGGAMLSKSFLPFSLKGGAVFPPCYLTWGQTMVEVLKIMVTSFTRRTDTLSAPTLQQTTTDPCLHRRLLDTHRQVLVSLLWGHCSLLLGPGAHKGLFVPSKSLYPQLFPHCFSHNAGDLGLIPGLGWPPLEKEMATHSSTLAWKIPWTEEPGRLQSTGSQRVGHDWAIFTFTQVLGCHSWHGGKDSSCECRGWEFDPWVGKIPFTYTHIPQVLIYTHTQPSSLICVS